VKGEDYLVAIGPLDRRLPLHGSLSAIGLTQIVSTDMLSIYVSKTTTVTRLKSPSSGFVIGPIFQTGTTAASKPALNGADAVAIIGSDGDLLLTRYWGAYVAILYNPKLDGITLLREPSGATGCYYIQEAGLVVAASSVACLEGTGIWRGRLDADALGQHLVTPQLRSADTCLRDLTELLAGSAMTVTQGGAAVTERWRPWTFAGSRAAYSNPNDAASDLHRVVTDTIGSWAGHFGQILLSVSGGLDSSIVAAALHGAHRPFTCLTLATQASSGDEREYARCLCTALEVELTEAFENPGLVDLSRSDAGGLPRPLARSFAQSHDRIALRTADAYGAKAHFMGGGGDNVFCYLQSSAPVVDRFLAEGFGVGLWRTAQDIGLLAEVSAIAVLRDGLRRINRGSRRYRWPLDLSFLSQDLRCRAELPYHPWLDVPPDGLPGKAAHIAWLLTIQNHLEGYAREDVLPVVSPLMSQPIIELCLRIPTWLWCEGGRNRAVARQAFRKQLPAEIVDRSTKGTPDSFVAALFDSRRSEIRSLLLDGRLAALGLLDLNAVAAVVNDRRPAHGEDYTRLMKLVDVETWSRCWAE